MKKTRISEDNKIILFILLVSVGIFARFTAMSFGNNFDFESYKIVGEIVSRGGNVYAETHRYNYGFMFSLIQGVLYKISMIANPADIAYTFRVAMVSILTFVDICITCWIVRKKSLKLGMIFFLNPISIIITGYHNQFDNIAILFALLAMDFVDDESKTLTKHDYIAIALLSVSMLTKHICFVFLIWMFFRKYGVLKRVAYAGVPLGIFLLSFIPFTLGNRVAFDGILHNVFLYRSYNNYPFFRVLFGIIPFPYQYFFVVYTSIMIIIGWIYRNFEVEKSFLLYLIAMVAFSSAVANQYLIIPLVALVLYKNQFFFCFYELLGFTYFLLNANELHMAGRVISIFPEYESIISIIASEGGCVVVLMTWVLAIPIILEIICCVKKYKMKT